MRKNLNLKRDRFDGLQLTGFPLYKIEQLTKNITIKTDVMRFQ